MNASVYIYTYYNCVEWMKRDLKTKQAYAYVSRAYIDYTV